MNTNYEKYFGTPEKLARMRVENSWVESEFLDGVTVWDDSTQEIIGTFWNQSGKQYEEWLKEECDG